MPNSLAGCTILVTRPTDQADSLLNALKQEGAKPWHFPLLKIEPVSSPLTEQRLNTLSDYSLAIFISRNAVIQAKQALGQRSLPASLQLASIGKSTAQEIKKHFDRPADIMPDSGFDSEALLAEPALANVKHQKILIFRGQGGRETLAKGLRQRGAQVDYAEIYRRSLPDVDMEKLNHAIEVQQVDAIQISSGEALDNLLILVKENLHERLFNIPLVVFHPRQSAHATKLGFTPAPVICQETSDTGIIAAFKRGIQPEASNHDF